jgi:predicted NAD-dependent protein-ADP-ribosyltransferase YbiA (DUF1768 family)
MCSQILPNKDLLKFLKSTGKTYLAEDNPKDGFWGIQISRYSPRSKNKANFKSDHLGLILIDIRNNVL